MKRFAMILTVLAVAVACVISVGAAEPRAAVYDDANFFTMDEQARIQSAADAAASNADCAFYIATFKVPLGMSSEDYQYTGDHFLREYGLRDDENIVLLVVTWDAGVYYYDLYTYGEAYKKINDKEVNYILDHDSVFDAIKGGEVTDGCCAFLAMAEQAFNGRVGVSYVIIVIVSLLIALTIGLVSCVSVYGNYKKKKKSVDYPLNRFAKLDLTEEQDLFAGTFITKRVIATNNGGGGGRGGSSHGGGGGHRGGR